MKPKLLLFALVFTLQCKTTSQSRNSETKIANPMRDIFEPQSVKTSVVQLILTRTDGNTAKCTASRICAGINKIWLLTAAHCVYNLTALEIVTEASGEAYRYLIDNANASIIPHPQNSYASTSSAAADIALIGLDKSNPNNKNNAHLDSLLGCLEISDQAIVEGNYQAAGWGAPSYLLGLSHDLYYPTSIANIETIIKDEYPQIDLFPLSSVLSGICGGDSGGPIFKSGSTSIMGVVAISKRKNNCDLESFPVAAGSPLMQFYVSLTDFLFSPIGGGDHPRVSVPEGSPSPLA